MSTPDKVCYKILIERMLKITMNKINKEQREFRTERGCVYQIYNMRMLIVYILEMLRIVCAAFMDLEKVYNRRSRVGCTESIWSWVQSY